MLSVDDIVRVVVRVHRETVSKNAFDTALMLVEDSEMDGISDVKTAANLAGALTILAAHGFNGESVHAEVVTKHFEVDPAPARLKMIFYGGESTAVQALEAASAADSGFYGVFLGQAETDTVVKGLAAAIEADDRALVFFVPVINTGEADAATETPASGSLLSDLYALAYQRTMIADFSEFSDIGALTGLAMGLQLTHEDRAFALCYKTLAGVTVVSLNQDGVDAVKELNGNVYIQRGNHYKVFENGSMMNGQRYDEVLYVDMISKDLQEAALGLLADNPDRMPQTDDASAQFINRMSGVLMGYRNMGVLAPAVWRGNDIGRIRNGDMIENGFALWAESYDLQSDEDRVAHKAMPIHAALTLAGSLESVVISVDVQG